MSSATTSCITISENALTIGIPNRGRLHQVCRHLMHQLFGLEDRRPRRLVMAADGGAMRVVAVRSSDIPTLLSGGVLDLGITSNELVLESGIPLAELGDLKMCAGHLALLLRAEEGAKTLDDLPSDMEIATQFPRCAELMLRDVFDRMVLRRVHGAAEAYPLLGLARGVFDVVATGVTAESNDLRVVAQFAATSARLYARPSGLETQPAPAGTVARTILAAAPC